MDKLQGAQTTRELFERALTVLLEELSPERAFIAYKEKGSQEFEPRGTHGIDPAAIFVTGEISLEVLKTVVHEGKPVHLVDAIQAPGYANRTSVILSGLRSILCVPIKHPSGLVMGMIYADNRLKAGAFKEEHLNWTVELAQAVAQKLVELAQKGAAQGTEGDTVISRQGDESRWAASRAEGIKLYQAGQVEQAEALLQEALSHAEGFAAKDTRYPKTMGELAELYRTTNQTDKAERLLIRAIELFENADQHHHPDLATILNNLAGLYYAQGNGTRAEGLYRRALKIWEETIDPGDRRLAPVLYNLGTLCRANGGYDEARRLFERALRVAESVWGPDDQKTVKCRKSYEEVASLS